MGIRGLMVFLAALFSGNVAFPASPAAAATAHRLVVTGTVDIKDDDVGTDDRCNGLPVSKSASMDHAGRWAASVNDDNNICDEVRIAVYVQGEIMNDDRLCNIVVDVTLYEDVSASVWPSDLDGHVRWAGGMASCLNPNTWFQWDVIRVDNTAEDAPDHGWVRNLRITHSV